jgi:hypothetical protein
MINSPYIVDGADLCRCGKRRGLHRYGDEACPNRLWTCGNGQPQWLSIVFTPTDGLDIYPAKRDNWGFKSATPTVYQTAGVTSQTVVAKGQPA